MVVLDKNDEDIRRFAGRYICINVLDCSMTAIHHSYSSETNFSIMVKLEMAKANTEEDEVEINSNLKFLFFMFDQTLMIHLIYFQIFCLKKKKC